MRCVNRSYRAVAAVGRRRAPEADDDLLRAGVEGHVDQFAGTDRRCRHRVVVHRTADQREARRASHFDHSGAAMHPPLGLYGITQRTGDDGRAVGPSERFEGAFAAVGNWQFDAVVAEFPTRRSDRCGDLCTRCGALELVDRCNHAHRRSLGFDAMGIANDIASLDATAQAELVRNGSVSAGELVEAAIEGSQRVNPQINAIIHPRYEAAIAEAASPGSGPFAGVPMVVKDLGCMMKNEPYHMGFARAAVGGLPGVGRLVAVPAVPRGRIRDHRPDQRSRTGQHHHDRTTRVSTVAQPVESRLLHRRIIGRFRGGGRGRHRRGRPRQ